MSDNKKRITLDDNNRLVVEDNNAVTTIEGTTSKISGKYEIADYDVEKLLVLINDKTILKKGISYSFIEKMYVSGTHIFSNNEALDKTLSIVSKEYNELNKDYKELMDRYMTMRSNFDNLLAKVKIHNETRLFNKIKLD